jgi:hypothetical protein
MSRFLVGPQRVTIRRHHLLIEKVAIDGLEGVIVDDVVSAIEKFFEGVQIAASVNQKLYALSPLALALWAVGHS